MKHEIVFRQELAPRTFMVKVSAPRIAARRKAGQFVILVVEQGGERVPLTIVDSDPEAGTITLVFQAVGKSTMKLSQLNVGDSIAHLAGPLGRPTHIEKYGTCVILGGGYGVAPVVPIAKALYDAGNEIIAINGARTAEAVILQEELGAFAARLEICTDDGTLGHKGFVTDVLQQILDEGVTVDFVVAVGPMPMMRAVAEKTRPLAIPTMVSLNPIMVDGTGMCGGCRVEVGGETKFACVDGPEFDGHLVDFDLAMARASLYKGMEAEARAQYEDYCRLQDVVDAEVAAKPKPKRPPRQPMPEQEPDERIHNFAEVALGYDEELAQTEATRCLQCKKPACVPGCPVGVDIPGFIRDIAAGDFDKAVVTMKASNSLPAMCGRVCPQEDQCEIVCVLKKTGDPVAIGNLERFVADYERLSGRTAALPEIKPTGKQIALVGSGPAGLAAAADLALTGHQVTVMEALHELGGVLVYGIPEFRLPKAILRHEVNYLRKLGVTFETDVVVGKTVTLEDLRRDYDAVFIGIGAGLPRFMGIPGEQLVGVVSANEYLTRVNLMAAYDWPNTDTPVVRGKNVVVVGGGNVAMDSARTAKRLGSERVIIAYRRSREEMPARAAEIVHAEEEGIEFMFLVTPLAWLGDENRRVRAATMQRMTLGEPDASGRRSPIPVEGSEFELPVDVAICAVGTGANPVLTSTSPELGLRRGGYIVTDEATGATNLPGVYAGGDIVTGAATVVEAMKAGRAAARAITEYLQEQEQAAH
jgi:glutamate synthase (NADPH) small chain